MDVCMYICIYLKYINVRVWWLLRRVESCGYNRTDRVIIRGEKHFTMYEAGKKATSTNN